MAGTTCRAIPRLRERYEVTLDSEVFSGYFVRTKGSKDDEEGGVSVQVFAPDAGMAREGGRTPLLCRGPTVREVSRVVGDVYRTIVQSDPKPDGDGAGEADRADDVRPPSV